MAVVPFSEFAGRKAEDIFSEVKRDGITLVSRDGEVYSIAASGAAL